MPKAARQTVIHAASHLLEHAAQSIRTRSLLRRGQSVLVAVSGGLDSMVLLEVLRELSKANGWRLAIAHLNHQLRGRSSDADERLVRRVAREFRLPAVIERADVRRLAATAKVSLEMAARQARHDFLARTAARLRTPTIALAHHADDQLELFFLRLLRGSGGEGLAGMKWRSPSPSLPKLELVRPFLDLAKSALRRYAAEKGLPFREDATNAMLDIQRNRIRHELLPLLRAHYQPGLDKTLLRVMEIGAAQTEFVNETALAWLKELRSANVTAQAGVPPSQAGKRTPGFLRSLASPFHQLPVAVQRRALQLQLLSLGIVGGFDLIEELRMNSGRPVNVSLGGTHAVSAPVAEPRWVARNGRGVVCLASPGRMPFKSGAQLVDLEGRSGEIGFGGARITWRRLRGGSRPARSQTGREFFDADRIGARIMLRHWQPGDRFQPIGMAVPVKLQDLFANQKTLRHRRRELLVAATVDGRVFWVEGLRISEQFKLTRGTTSRLQWCWKRP